MVFSKTLAGARTFSQALAGRQIGKTYLAVLTGSLEGPWEVRENLVRDDDARTTRVAADGAASMTHFRPLARAPGLTLAEVDLGTGRTHQIRVHAQSLGLPLAGDQKYGGGARGPGPAGGWILHAWKLESELLPAVAAPLEPGLGAWVEKTFKISL